MSKFKVNDKVRVKGSPIAWSVQGVPDNANGMYLLTEAMFPKTRLFRSENDLEPLHGWQGVGPKFTSTRGVYRGFGYMPPRSSNSVMNAKFKVGDWVKLPNGKIGTIVKVVSFGGKTDNIIDVPGMSMTSRRDDELTLANSSTNLVVANALAWQRAINAKDSEGKELKVGDRIKVQIDMYGPWEGGGVVTALKPYRIVEYKDVFGHINTIQENSVLKV